MSEHAQSHHLHDPHGDSGDEHEHAGTRTYTIIFLALVGLLVLTVIAGLVDLGRLNVAIALSIATVKAVMVVLWFMHVRYSGRLVWVFSAAAFLWLGIMLVLTMSDYASRGWTPRRLEDRPAARALPFSPRASAPPWSPPYQLHSDQAPRAAVRETSPAHAADSQKQQPASPQPRGQD